MKPKQPQPLDKFELEKPTRPSAQNPLKSGKHASFREPTIEDASPKTGARRRHSAERETVRKPTTWSIDDEAAPTPRPRVAFTQVPTVVMHESDVVELPLRAPAGFILGLCDGKTTVQTLVDISGMEMDEVLRVIDELLLFGVIRVK